MKEQHHFLNVNDAGNYLPNETPNKPDTSTASKTNQLQLTLPPYYAGITAYSISPLLSNSHISLATTQLSLTILSLSFSNSSKILSASSAPILPNASAASCLTMAISFVLRRHSIKAGTLYGEHNCPNT